MSAAPQSDEVRARELYERFEPIWSTPSGLRALTGVNHTSVGLRFIVTGFVFFILGGLLAMMMRIQLSVADNDALDHQTYREFFTMHGTTMMFLFAVPILEGFAAYLIPKMIGARDLIFPRLGAFGYYCYLFGGLLLYSSFFFQAAPDSGWFMYVPLSDKMFSPGLNTDFWLLGVTFVEISAVAAAIELICSILRTRAPGMSLERMPIFAWAILVTAFMIVIAFPPLIMASIMLEIERAFGFIFYDAARGGHPLLWQHLFWFFGHPEVYIVFLPAAGMLSMVIPVFSGHPLVGYKWVVLAIIGMGFLSFGLWVHHMYAVGIPYLSLAFFAAASFAVVIPSGIQVFAWIATMWQGRPRFTVPMLYVAGFFFIFVLGGLTGVMVAFVPFDWAVHDTHFVVAHLHYVLIGGMVFPLLAGLYYWLPLFVGRKHSDSLGRLAFWLIFIGFNVTFLPMHYTGLLGMPRRVYTYASGLGWDTLNLVSTVGSFVMTVGFAVVLVDVLLHAFHGRRAKRDPWQSNTLEWAIDLPVPSYNFNSIPPVTTRYPLWQEKGLVGAMDRGEYFLGDPSSGQRETLGTSAVSAEPTEVIRLSKSSWMPLLTAIPVGFVMVGMLVQAYWLSIAGIALVALCACVWAWNTGHRYAPDAIDAGCGLTLPSHYASPTGPAWWGIWMTVLADVALYAALLYAYFFLWAVTSPWPPPDHAPASYALPALALALLAASSVALHLAVRARRRGRAGFEPLLLVAAALALGWMVLQLLAHPAPEFERHAYASVVFLIVAFNVVHVAIALLMAGWLILRSLAGFVTPARSLEPRVVAVFWHYSVLQWAVGFVVIYLIPLLG